MLVVDMSAVTWVVCILNLNRVIFSKISFVFFIDPGNRHVQHFVYADAGWCHARVRCDTSNAHLVQPVHCDVLFIRGRSSKRFFSGFSLSKTCSRVTTRQMVTAAPAIRGHAWKVRGWPQPEHGHWHSNAISEPLSHELMPF